MKQKKSKSHRFEGDFSTLPIKETGDIGKRVPLQVHIPVKLYFFFALGLPYTPLGSVGFSLNFHQDDGIFQGLKTKL